MKYKSLTMSSINTLNKIKFYGIIAKKKYGQNFLFDENILSKIVQKSNITEKINILEIGPGPGGLTKEILKANVNQVYVVEKDKDFLPILNDIKNIFPNKLNIIYEDALNFDIKMLNNFPFKIISNLPYNISTVLLIKWLTSDICNTNCLSLTLMFQKEVAERIVAKTGSSSRSRISLISELYTNPKLVLKVSSGSFIPKPKVDSALIYFEILKEPRYKIDLNRFKIIVDAAFNQKRKMVRSSLKNIFPNTTLALQKVGIEETKRPQSIDLKFFCDLSLI